MEVSGCRGLFNYLFFLLKYEKIESLVFGRKATSLSSPLQSTFFFFLVVEDRGLDTVE